MDFKRFSFRIIADSKAKSALYLHKKHLRKIMPTNPPSIAKQTPETFFRRFMLFPVRLFVNLCSDEV